MKLILAVTKNGGIAKEGKIPWKISDELAFFKRMTYNHTVIMGRKTYESIGKPLPGRNNIIVGTGHSTMREAAQKGLALEKEGKLVWVIGGSAIAEAFQPYITEAFLSVIEGPYECDLFAPQYVLDSVTAIRRLFETQLPPEERKKMIAEDVCAPRIYATSSDYTVYQCFYTENREERKFQELIQTIIDEGVEHGDRTGVGTISIFGHQLQFSLENGNFPMSTLRRSFFKGIFEELMWFLRGQTDAQILSDKGIKIWEGNSTREALDKIGLTQLQPGDCGACFVAGTPVLTETGYVNIEDISSRTNVLTHRGNWMPVVTPLKRKYNGNLYTFRMCYNSREFKCTGEHPIYTMKYTVKNRVGNRRNVVYYNLPNWEEAKNIGIKTHMVGFPINQESIVPVISLTRYINQHMELLQYDKQLNNIDEWYLMGYFLGDGWVVGETNDIQFAIGRNRDEVNVLTKLTRVLDIKMVKDEGGCSVYRVRNAEWAHILGKFGKYAHGKLIPEWVVSAPLEYIREFLQGYQDADGCIRKTRTNTSIRYTTVSKNIAYTVQRLYLKLGHFASISFQERDYLKEIQPGKFSHCKDVYFIEVYPNGKRRSNYSVINEGYAWFTIKDINVSTADDIDVYNMSVETDESYCVYNNAVHNCYGFQWRHWGAKYVDCKTDYTGQGVDQLSNLIAEIRRNPFSRRLLLSGWNVGDLQNMCLPPCHTFYQFEVSPAEDGGANYLSCHYYQRSSDVLLAGHWNITSASLFTILLAHFCGLRPKKLVVSYGNVHIYNNHRHTVAEHLQRYPFDYPTLTVNPTETRENLWDYQFGDVKVEGYISHQPIALDMNT